VPIILVVEDESDIANMLKIYFTGQGYDIELAARGGDALKMVQQQLPCLPGIFTFPGYKHLDARLSKQ